MLYYLHLLADYVSYLRVFQYITVRMVAGAGTAFLISLLLGPWLIRRLARLTSNNAPRYKDDLPALETLHGDKKKQTPTMGGLLIITATAGSCLLWAVPTCPVLWPALLTFGVMGAIGFADDFIKTVHKNPKGLSGRKKLLLQALWVAGLTMVLLIMPETRVTVRKLMVPFLKAPLIAEMWLIAVFLFVAVVIVGASNAVNLTDGLDGLAIGCAASVALAYMVMAYVAGHAKFADYLQIPYVPGSGELAVLCGCLLGACLGFLWFNCHPALVFMGDTGSLALGGALGCVAVLIKQELVLAVVGGVFVLEALSVMLQVGCFKWKRRRIFACSPLHHHFELKPTPWSETQVTVRFWIISIIFALIGLLLLKIR
ncbi:MAG: phospho-N-acetylmuramoyl-pentapeptide-transferase [Lentisphaerae bacterium]|nr:phospho-N-acetylmuramoyl-pentapeptide-transferase [Lentisphaerota bacterium]